MQTPDGVVAKEIEAETKAAEAERFEECEEPSGGFFGLTVCH